MTQANFMHLVKTAWIWSRDVPVFGQGRDSGGDNQAQSVKEQEMVYREFVEHYQLSSQGFFGDEAKKSTKSDNRPSLQNLLDIIKVRFPRIDDLYVRERLKEPRAIVIVWSFDRLSRDPSYAAWIRAELALCAIVVLELSVPPPTGNGLVDDITFRVHREGDRQVLEKIRMNAKRGQAINQSVKDTNAEFRRYNPDWPTSDGRYVGIADGKPPVGFCGEKLRIGTKTRERKEGHKGIESTPRIVQRLVPDDKKWTRCYQAWLMRHEGNTLKEIHQATRLFKNEQGYAHFFANRIYTGDYEHSGVLYEKFVPALISLAWYEAEQARRKERGKKMLGEPMAPGLEPRRVSSSSLLSGKLYCTSVPGERHPMHSHRSGATKNRSRWDAYECSVHKHTHGENCPHYGISLPTVDKAVTDVILRDVITRENLRPLITALNGQLASRQTVYTAELTHLQTQITEAERQRRKYDKLIADDDDPSPTLVAELKKFEREKMALQERKRQLESSGPSAIGAEPITDAQLDVYVERVRTVLNGGDELLARRILDHFVDSVDVKKDSTTGTLHYTFPSGFFSDDLSPLPMPSLEGFRVRAFTNPPKPATPPPVICPRASSCSAAISGPA
jgi:hypothetical protein